MTTDQSKVEQGNRLEFKSSHDLIFEVAPWVPLVDFPAAKEFIRFRVGTCFGIWRSTEDSYDILGITNETPGNGHFEDVLEWFKRSCRRDKKHFRILEVWNKKLKRHLVSKRGFKDIGGDNVEFSFKKIKSEYNSTQTGNKIK